MLMKSKFFWQCAALLLLSVLIFAWALTAGEISTTWQDVRSALLGQPDSLGAQVVAQLRLPRALAAFACGGLLALAGALMQALLRNPLADPYVLGISGGASLGALGAMLAGLGGVMLEACAFGGASLAMFLVFALAHGEGSWTHTRLLLVGVVVASGCGAGVSLLLSLAPANDLPGMLFWLMGDISAARHPVPALIVLGLAVLGTQAIARDLNVLSRGEAQAMALGVPARTLRILIFLLASLLTAVAVSLIGAVGFVGLLAPHAVRLVLGNDQRRLLPAVAWLGGSLLLAADTLARTILAPVQLPVGILTALIGVPGFLYLLNRQRRGRV